MHFGKIVKGVAYARNLSASDLAALFFRTETEVLELYEQKEWTSGDIKIASAALEHNFGKYLDYSLPIDFLNLEESSDKNECFITVKYPKGKSNYSKPG